jgi:uncharacterized protein YecE (DUF72 family)
MDFGRIEVSQLNQIDFRLPKEPIFNVELLRNANKANKTKFYLGLSKWGRKEFIGKLYPSGTKDAQFAEEYIKCYNAIELNATHYKLYSKEDLNKWISKAEGKDFLFCPKAYQGITHFGTLTDKGFLTDAFLSIMSHFENHLGPILLQLSDKFSPKRKEDLFAYLRSLPKQYQYFLEIRHTDWQLEPNKSELFQLLRALNIGTTITDTAGRRDIVHMYLSIPTTFIRFVANNKHPTDYARLDEWVTRLKLWADNGLERVFFFMHCLDEAFAPELTQYLIQQLNEKCDANLKEINFYNQA